MPIHPKRLLVLLLVSSVSTVYGQDQPFITQRHHSRINYNPAAAGNDRALDIFVAYRNQWMGFKHAPVTTLLNVHTTVDRFHSGVGASFGYDTEGVARRNRILKLLYSYRIRINSGTQLSFGLGVHWQHRSIDFSQLVAVNPLDPALGLGNESQSVLGADFGMEWLTERLLIGVSATNLGRQPTLYTSFVNGSQYHAYARYTFFTGDSFELSPAASYMYANEEHHIEVGGGVFIRHTVWLGASYRLRNSLCFTGGVAVGAFRIGYSYDHGAGDVRRMGATHEVVLSISIWKSPRSYLNPDGTYTVPPGRVYQCQ